MNRIASSYTNTPADRDDLVQDMALALWRALPAFRRECSMRTFVYRIAHNRALHFLARRRTSDAALEQTLEPADPAPSLEAIVLQKQNVRKLSESVRRLPIGYRHVVVLLLEGLDYAEIGEVLGISESNVGVRLNRARTLLRQIMEGQK